MAKVRLVSEEHDDPTNTLGPITGFAQYPVVSLHECAVSIIEALPSFSNSVHSFTEYDLSDWVDLAIEAAKKLSCQLNENPYGLTEQEIGAIHLYTQETNFYKLLNTLLRKEDRQQLQPFLLYLRLFTVGCEKLPSFTSKPVWRGVKANLLPLYSLLKTSNQKVRWWMINSCSLNLEISDEFISDSEYTLFNITCKTGKDISQYSASKAENEIVLLPGTRLVVVGVSWKTKVVELDEQPVTLLSEKKIPKTVTFPPTTTQTSESTPLVTPAVTKSAMPLLLPTTALLDDEVLLKSTPAENCCVDCDPFHSCKNYHCECEPPSCDDCADCCWLFFDCCHHSGYSTTTSHPYCGRKTRKFFNIVFIAILILVQLGLDVLCGFYLNSQSLKQVYPLEQTYGNSTTAIIASMITFVSLNSVVIFHLTFYNCCSLLLYKISTFRDSYYIGVDETWEFDLCSNNNIGCFRKFVVIGIIVLFIPQLFILFNTIYAMSPHVWLIAALISFSVIFGASILCLACICHACCSFDRRMVFTFLFCCGHDSHFGYHSICNDDWNCCDDEKIFNDDDIIKGMYD